MRRRRVGVIFLGCAFLASMLWVLTRHNENALAGGAAEPAYLPRPRPAASPTVQEAVVAQEHLVLGVPDGGAPETASTAQVRRWLDHNAVAAEQHVEEFCRKSRALTHFRVGARTRDAAIFMAVRCDWEEGQDSLARVGLLHLGQPLIDRMQNPPLNWLSFQSADLEGLDFSWFAQLREFDYWSLSGDGPIQALDSLSTMSVPVPNFVSLQHWAKLRLIKGAREADLPAAAAEVRHLAALCGSTSTLLGEMVQVSILGIERTVWESVGQAPPGEIPSALEAHELRGLLVASSYFLHPGVPRAVKVRALGCAVSRCGMLSEALGATAGLRDVIPGADAELSWLLSQQPCDEGLAQRFSRGPAVAIDASFSEWPGVWAFEPDGGN